MKTCKINSILPTFKRNSTLLYGFAIKIYVITQSKVNMIRNDFESGYSIETSGSKTNII